MNRIEMERMAAYAIDDICKGSLLRREDVIKALYSVPVRDEITKTAQMFRVNPPTGSPGLDFEVEQRR
jgi:hypothetical protein